MFHCNFKIAEQMKQKKSRRFGENKTGMMKVEDVV